MNQVGVQIKSNEIDEHEVINGQAGEEAELDVSNEEESAPCCGCCGG